MQHQNQTEPLNEIPEHIYCPKCAYHLFRITSDRCPECGHGLEDLRSDHSAIPWVRRNEIGRFRAYWKTVWMVPTQNRKFCEEYAREVSYDDAQAFRWLTILHAWLPSLVGVIVLYIHGLPAPGGGPNVFPWQARSQTTILDQAWQELWPAGLILAGLFLCLVAVTGLPSYFFHPRSLPTRLQNNAIALSYYTSGTMSFGAVAVLLAVLGVILGNVFSPPAPAFYTAATAVVLVIAVLWLDRLYQLMSGIMPHLRRRRVVMVVCVSLLWLLCVFLFCIGLPLAVLYVLVAIASLG